MLPKRQYQAREHTIYAQVAPDSSSGVTPTLVGAPVVGSLDRVQACVWRLGRGVTYGCRRLALGSLRSLVAGT